MSVSCLNSLIKILSNCGTPTRETGVMYLDDIGISLQDAIDANDNHATGQALIDNKTTFCQTILAQEIQSAYNGQLKRQGVISNGVIGNFRENRIEQANSTSTLGGIYLEINKYPYLEYYIHKVRLFVKESASITINIYDAITGKVLFTKAATTTAQNYTEIDINQAFSTNGQSTQLFISYNKQNITTYQTETGMYGCSSCVKGKTFDGFGYSYGAAIPSGTAINKTNLRLGGDTSGMSVIYSLNCSIDNFVCSIRNILQYPLLYLVASKIMEEIVFSKRTNSTTIIFRGDAREMMERFDREYNVKMFGAFDDNGRKIKDGILDQIALPNDICFKCTQRVKRRINIP